jgi:hypothetical protein
MCLIRLSAEVQEQLFGYLEQLHQTVRQDCPSDNADEEEVLKCDSSGPFSMVHKKLANGICIAVLPDRTRNG